MGQSLSFGLLNSQIIDGSGDANIRSLLFKSPVRAEFDSVIAGSNFSLSGLCDATHQGNPFAKEVGHALPSRMDFAPVIQGR